jgi:hypothetical protein
MSSNPKIDRSFTYDSVNIYYKYKISQFAKQSDLILPTTNWNTTDELCAHLETVASERSLPLTKCSRDTPYQWTQFIESHPATVQQEIWKYREYVYACSVLFIASFIQKAIDAGNTSIAILSGLRQIPANFDINKHKFTIVGSSKLTSDIDITIQGSTSSFLISLLEDLYEYMSYKANIPIRCWDVEFYGDFKILQNLFVNMSKFESSDKLITLVYALISYFRSSHKNYNQVHPIVSYLVNYCLQHFVESDKSPGALIQGAYNKYMTEIPDGKLNREFFYRELREVEDISEIIKPYLKTIDNNKIISNNAGFASKYKNGMPAFALFYGIMRGNVHRPESYIVPSTAVHVVEFEQKKGGMFTDSLPDSWLSSNARIGIDTFGFIISAIEQIGYLEHYHPEDTECNKKGIKYFGRLIRALVQAGLLSESSKLVTDSTQLNAYRSTEDDTIICQYNVHILLYELQNILEKVGKAQKTFLNARRRTRKRVTNKRNLNISQNPFQQVSI